MWGAVEEGCGAREDRASTADERERWQASESRSAREWLGPGDKTTLNWEFESETVGWEPTCTHEVYNCGGCGYTVSDPEDAANALQRPRSPAQVRAGVVQEEVPRRPGVQPQDEGSTAQTQKDVCVLPDGVHEAQEQQVLQQELRGQGDVAELKTANSFPKGHEPKHKFPKGQRPMHYQGWKLTGDGYKLVHRPNHPNAQKRGYVLEHRLVMSEVLGRPLNEWERVHTSTECGTTTDRRISS